MLQDGSLSQSTNESWRRPVACASVKDESEIPSKRMLQITAVTNIERTP
jgi:hypothetical protein